MSHEISQENEHFIQQVIEEGSYRDRAEVLDEAIELLKERRELLDHIDVGTQQLRHGEDTEKTRSTTTKLFENSSMKFKLEAGNAMRRVKTSNERIPNC